MKKFKISVQYSGQKVSGAVFSSLYSYTITVIKQNDCLF